MGLLGSDFPEQLMHTVFFTLGLSCALRAGKEHHKLRSIPFDSQLSWHRDSSGKYYLLYREDLSLKTNKGGLRQRKIKPKVVSIYPIPNSVRCPVMLIMKYLSLLPQNRTCKALYLQPKKKYDVNCWYQDHPVGVNKLQSVVRDVCRMGNLPGFYTNHSLRATAATHLYQNNYDEQIIQEFTGHCSLAVREYKRTSEDQKRSASGCIMGVDSEVPPFKRMKYSE